MGPSVLLESAEQIFEFIQEKFPKTSVLKNEARQTVTLVLPQGARIPIQTVVSDSSLTEAIDGVAAKTLSPEEASEALQMCTPLSWNAESNSTVRRKLYEQIHGHSCSQAIRAYLTLPADQTFAALVRELGLGPHQVHANDDADLRYFEDIGTWGLPEPARQFYMNTYCEIHEVLAAEAFKQAEDESRNKEPTLAITASIVEALQKEIVQQPMAIQATAAALVETESRDNTPFLFVGPPGVGKTVLALAVAKLKGNGKFAKFDMTGYVTKGSSAHFTGAGTGLVGSDDLPEFGKELRERTNWRIISRSAAEEHYLVYDSTIIFDEFGKAESDVITALNPIFDKGTFTLRRTNSTPSPGEEKNVTVKYTFEKCIFICTSNLFEQVIESGFKENRPPSEIAMIVAQTNAHAIDMKTSPPGGEAPFKKEVMDKFTIIPFGPVPKGPDGLQKIIRRELELLLSSWNTIFRNHLPGEFHSIVIEESGLPHFLEKVEDFLCKKTADARDIDRLLKSIYTALVNTRGLNLTSRICLALGADDKGIYGQRYFVNELSVPAKKTGDPIELIHF